MYKSLKYISVLMLLSGMNLAMNLENPNYYPDIKEQYRNHKAIAEGFFLGTQEFLAKDFFEAVDLFSANLADYPIAAECINNDIVFTIQTDIFKILMNTLIT